MDKQNIESIYPLASLQQAFLWRSLQTSSQAGLLHMRCTLRGELDPILLRQAWECVVSRHPALRASVHWQAVKQPLQVVARRVTLPWAQLDWRDMENAQSALADFLAADRDRGFDLTQAPIMRLTLIRLSETDYELVWSCHHLMLDGWSGALVLNQVFDSYRLLRQGQPLAMAPTPTYQAYIRWLKQQDEAAAAAFWRERLKGFTVPTPLPVGWRGGPGSRGAGEPPPPPDTPTPSYTHSLALSTEVTAKLPDFLRSQRLTLNTLMQGVWALLLYRYSGQEDVLFGATVSGRQGDLAEVEAIVGLLINVLPVRVQVAPEQAALIWLQALQTQQTAASRYAYASLMQIQAWSELSGRGFDSLLVIENYPIHPAASDPSLHVDNIQSGIVSAYGLTLIVKPGAQPGAALTLTLRAKPRFREGLKPLLDQVQAVLSAVIENPMQSIRELLSSPKGGIDGASPLAPPTPSAIAPPPAATPDLSRETLEGDFCTPRNSLELKLSQIWESVLGVRPLSVQANFFDLGGDSLMAVQLFNQMQQRLNCTLPLATLFQAPNVRTFAQLLSQDQPVAHWSSLVPIQLSGSQRPFFFHGGSADALTWARFSHLLGPDQPFYALQRPDLDGGEVVHTTVEALATACVKEMRMVQPAGPYLVGGHCFGGAVAFEIAQQLQAQGEEITSLILIDAYRPRLLPKTRLIQLQIQLQLSLFWLRKNYYYHGGWEKLALLPDKVWRRVRPQTPSHPFIDSAADLAANHPIANHSSANPVENADSLSPGQTAEPKLPYEYRYARAQEANELAAERYSPQVYSGRIQLFRAQIQTLDWYFGPTLGWQRVAKDKIAIATLPGFFGNLFNQQSGPLLAAQVKAYLSTLP